MNYINEMQKAIDYIEINLDKDINFEKVSKKVGMSPFYFHRIFTAMIGVSPTTYIRNRRLTIAAQEISKNDESILDIALKYGFESHEAFSRAFKNFHGIVPKMAKSKGNKLKNFSMANMNFETEQSKILSYRIENRAIIRVIAMFRNFNIEHKNEIPKYWKELKEDGTLERISGNYKNNLLGICIGTQSDVEYKYGIGIEQTEDVETNIEMEKIEIPASTWVVFKCEGQNENGINELWSRIYKEFFVTSSYKQSMDIDFELYDDKNTEIWIPISKE